MWESPRSKVRFLFPGLLLFLVTWLLPLALSGPIPEPIGTAPTPQELTSTSAANGSEVTDQDKSLVMKRSVEDAGSAYEGAEYELPQENDPYPMLISKKSAEVLNKLVTALQHSLGPNVVRTSDFLSDKELIPVRNSPNYELFNLQRRNQKDRKNYLRCYFNAVSCF